MADRIDIFGDGTGIAEPEVPTFLGVEQEKLTKSQYQSQYTNFFSQYYGMEALEGLGDTGVGVDEPENITELATPEVKEPGGGGDGMLAGTFETSFPGSDYLSDLSYDYSGGSNPYDSYSDYLKAENIMTDRIPTMEFLTEPLFTGNFAGIDLSKAAFGEYKSAETAVKEAPGKLGDILKGNITEEQKKSLVAGAFGAMGGLFGATLGSLISGETVKNAFGNPSLRPSGPLGVMHDITQVIQYRDMAQIRAAHVANAPLKATVGSSVGTMDFGEAGRSLSSLSPTGFAMEFSTGFGVTRAPGSIHYNGNTMGMSRSQLEAFDALSKGMIPKGFDVKTETGTTIKQAGWLDTGKTTTGNGQGYYTSTGSFYSPSTNSYAAYGLKESAIAAAAKAGISLDAFNDALAAARKGIATLEDGIKAAQQAQANEAEAARQKAEAARQKAEADARAAAAADQSQRELARASGGGGGGQSHSGNEAGYGAGGSHGLSHARGGKVGYAFGTPEGGVQAPSGFIDAPPSQVAEGQKVADNRDMEVPEGTYVLNAAAVEFAGEQDIRKMIMDAQKEAVRRGITQDSGERASELVDIAVSSGEVTIAPHLVKIIGEDRLEKINNRGLRKTEERIAQNGQQPTGAAEGGFILPKPKPNQVNQAALGDVELRADMEEFIQTDPLARLGWNLYEKGDLDIKAVVLPAKKRVEVGVGGVYTPKGERRDPGPISRKFEGFAEQQGLTKSNNKVAGIHYFAGENVNYGRYDATVTLLHELRHHAMRHIAEKYKAPLPELSVEESMFDAQDYANRIQARKVKPSIPDAPKEKELEIRQSGRYMSPSANKQIAMYQSVAEEVLKDRKVPTRTKSKEVEGFFTRAMGMLGL